MRVRERGDRGRGNSDGCLDGRCPGLQAADGDAIVSRGSAEALPARQACGLRCRCPSGASRIACHREQALGVSAVRPHGSHEHACAAGHGRRRGSGQGNEPRARIVGRRQRPILLSRSVPRRHPCGRRSRAKRRVCRRGTDWRDQLSEFRQSRAAGNHVAVRTGGRRYHRRV